MEFLILGLLILSPMTGYELQQFIKQNLSLICSHSAGSVQSALTKLLGAYIYGDYAPENTLTVYGSLNQSVEDALDYTEFVKNTQKISSSKNRFACL